jgi:hypothetical protein
MVLWVQTQNETGPQALILPPRTCVRYRRRHFNHGRARRKPLPPYQSLAAPEYRPILSQSARHVGCRACTIENTVKTIYKKVTGALTHESLSFSGSMDASPVEPEKSPFWTWQHAHIQRPQNLQYAMDKSDSRVGRGRPGQ